MSTLRPSSSPTPYSNGSLPDALGSNGSPHRNNFVGGGTATGFRAAPPRGHHNHAGPSNFANMIISSTVGGGGGNGMFGANGPKQQGVVLPSTERTTSRHSHHTPNNNMFNSEAPATAAAASNSGSSPPVAAAGFGGGAAAVGNRNAAGLRPLPQTVRQTGLLNMMIQGHSAGEGRTLVPTEPRVPLDRKSNAPLETGINKDARDTTKMRKLESELEKLKELLKKRTTERDKANGRVEELEKQLAEANKRLASNEASLSAALFEKSQQIVALQLSVKQLEEKLAKQAADFEKSKSQSGKDGAELEALRGLLEKEKTQRSEAEENFKKQIADLQKRIDESNESKRRSSSDLQGQVDRLQRELEAKTRESTSWEEKANRYQQELKAQEASFAEWKARIEAINAYILKICQPQFSVVKDETLAPVAPAGDGSQDGYVLVPLPLMLQGYALLPQELKKRIANDYEANKKDFASALPRRASRA